VIHSCQERQVHIVYPDNRLMVHTRLNEKVENPNPNVNFITALSGPPEGEAVRLLRALAAQLKPVMKVSFSPSSKH
jgi:hypothetical protein